MADELPRANPIPRRGPKVDDIVNLAMLLKTIGVLCGLLGFIIIWATLWGLVPAGAGVAFFLVGRGMGQYRRWAWYGAVALLVPVFLGFGALGVMGVIYGGASSGAVVFVRGAGYVLWVLLSKGGRKRYDQLAQSMEELASNPRSSPARFYRRK